MINSIKVKVTQAENLSPRLKTIGFYYFATGFVFWYAIEKLFLQQLGATAFQILMTLNIAYGCGVLFEFPSSVIADRWSRNKTLALSLCFAWLSALLAGTAHGINQYYVAMVFWALASALHSGTAEALTYDVLVEEGTADNYNKIQSIFNAIFASALLISISFGSVIAAMSHSFRASYLATLILMPVGIILIAKLKEPIHHKLLAQKNYKKHTIKAIKNLTTNKNLIVISVMLLVTNFLVAIPLYDFTDLYMKSHGLPLMFIGLGKAISTNGLLLIGTPLFIRFYVKSRKLMPIIYFLAAIALFMATKSNYSWLIVLFGVGVVLQQMVSTWLASDSQDLIPSSERATTTSIVNLVGSLAWIIYSPLVLTNLLNKHGVNGVMRPSAYIAMVLFVFAFIFYRKIPMKSKRLNLNNQSETPGEIYQKVL